MTRAFASAAADLILEQGPLSLDALHALAVDRGLTRSRTASSLAASLAGEQYVQRPDGRYDTAARLLRGQVFTTRAGLTASEGVLWTSRDLDPLVALPSLPLATGGEMRRGAGAAESWTGPDGWLPEAPSMPLLGLRWDGAALHVESLPDAAEDLPRAQEVREVLGRHARSRRQHPWSYEPRSSLTQTVLSALVERPALFAVPLPPLRELLPLPEDLRPQDAGGRADPLRTATIVEVPVPLRVHEELARRADLLGERLPDYLCLLLTAAADRVQLPPPRYDRYEPYEPAWRDGVPLTGWRG